MKKPKISLVLIIIFSVFGCVLIGGYVYLKAITSDEAIKKKITDKLEGFTGGKLDIERAHFDMFKGLSIDMVKFEGEKPENLRVEVESILIRHEPLALLRGELLVNSIIILSPELFMIREKGTIWKFLSGVKAFLDHSGIKYPTDQLRSGVTVKTANIHVFDKKLFREGVLNIENLDLFGQQFGGSLRDINIKGIVNDGFWKGMALDVNTNLATPELKLVAQLRDKTMTEELMKELPVIGEKFWKEYSPEGKFDFDCSLNFNNKNNERKLDYKLELDLVDGNVMYIKWPFLIKHVNGKLEFSSKGVFLKGMNGDIQNEGQKSHGEVDAFFGVGNARKSVNLSIPNFNITEKLLKMVPDVGEKVWHDYQPKGNIDLTIKYESNRDKSVIDYSAKASCKGIKVSNPFVPYDVSNVVGIIEMDGSKIYLKNMSGYLLNGPNLNLTMLNGMINLKNKHNRFTISIPNLNMTEKMVKSIPKKGEDIWARYKPTGQVDCKLDFKGFNDPEKLEYVVTVDGKGNEIEYADLSMKVSDVIGRVIVNNNDVQLKNLRGYVVNDNQLARTVCNGVYKLKNSDMKTLYNVFDLRVTEDLLKTFSKQLKNEWLDIAPVGWVDVIVVDEKNNLKDVEKHLIIADAKGCEISLTSPPFTFSDLEGRVNIEDGYLTSRKFSGTCGGGTINGSVVLDTSSSNGEYSGKLNFYNMSLQKVMKNFVSDHQKWTGDCNGDFEFKGKGNDLMNFTAKGSAKLRNGYLSEVPVVLSILKLLNLSLPKKEAFHTANIKYSIKDKIINVEALEVFSDSVELGCIGTVGFDSTIDLTVVAGFNKETFSQIPFIGGLMDFVVGGVRKSLTKVRLTGKLSNPQSTMIGLKPFTYPITSIIDVITPHTKTKDDKKEKGENEENENEKVEERTE